MNGLAIRTKQENEVFVEVDAGVHISEACRKGIVLSADLGKPVAFDFNGIRVVATSVDTAEALMRKFNEDCALRTAQWKASEEGQQYERDRQASLEQAQAKVNALLSELPQATTASAVVKWVGAFAAANDHVGLVFDKQALVRQLESFGFEANAEVGSSASSLQSDPGKYARYIVGQAMDFLNAGMPIHPVATTWAERFEKCCLLSTSKAELLGASQ